MGAAFADDDVCFAGAPALAAVAPGSVAPTADPLAGFVAAAAFPAGGFTGLEASPADAGSAA